MRMYSVHVKKSCRVCEVFDFSLYVKILLLLLEYQTVLGDRERERDPVYFVAALTACRNGRQQYSDDEGSADVSLPVTTDGRSVRRRNGKNASSLRRLPRL